MKSSCKIVSALAGFVLSTSALAASTIYVDCNLADYTGHDGSSWAKAFKTIQDGVDKASADDTVLVQPGYYTEGGKAHSSDSYLTNRVYISKRITVKSRYGRDSRDSTFIVGRHATVCEDPAQMGMGLDAIRCVRFAANDSTYGAVLEGFTLINGATHYNKGNYAACSVGGGAFFGERTTSDKNAAYLVDCVVSNCVATRGAAMYFGNAVRCRITGNYAYVNGAGVRDSNLYWSILDHNFGSGGPVYLGKTRCINCTIVNHPVGNVVRGNSTDGTYCTALNSVILHNKESDTAVCITLTNCVIDSSRDFCWQDNVAGGFATSKCVRVANTSHQFISTALNDYRVLPNSDLIGVGDAQHLLRIPEPYRYVDYLGHAVTNAGAIVAGAIQEAVTPLGGAIVYSSFAFRANNTPGARINGVELMVDKIYDYAMTYPKVHRIEYLAPAAKASTTELFGYSCNLNGNNTVYAFPNRVTPDVAIMAPPVGNVLTVTPQYTDKILWTDPSVPDSAEMDGTAAKPFNTLQAAVEKAAENTNFNIIHAKKGHYNRGGGVYGDHNNRVAINVSSLYVRFVADDGPEVTFIEGAEDPDSTHPLKYGSNAYRCFASKTGCGQLCGFTLSGGRVGLPDTGIEDVGSSCLYGGAMFAQTGFQVEDCIITNCAGSRGAVAWQATLKRCLITDCTSSWLGAMRGTTHASACVFKNIHTLNTGDQIIGQNETAYNCTFIGEGVGSAMRVIGNSTSSAIHNSIVYNFAELPYNNKSIYSGVYYDAIGQVAAKVDTIPGLTAAAIGFADATQGDYAPYSASQVVGGGVVPGPETDFWRYGSVDDIEGHSLGFEDGGTFNAGAYSRTAASMAVNTGTDAGISPQGVTFITPNAPVTVTATEATSRNYQGLYQGDQLLTTDPTWTLTYDAALEGTQLAIEARYIPYWFVDPTASDANSGCDWAHAKRTLAAVMKLARSGDTVFAAPGVYDEGSAHQDTLAYAAPSNIYARVVVPEGVTLISRDGAAVTTIKGRAADNDADGYGGGANALRCAFLYKHAQLIGFTLTGGRGSADEAICDDARGAGVHGSGPSTATDWTSHMPIVKDCIITNCITRRGAGATLVKAVNCRFVDNRATGLAAATQHCQLHNCFVDGNHGAYAVAYSTGMYGCTIGAHHDGGSVLGPSTHSSQNQRPYVYNSLILCSAIHTNDGGGAFTNCVFNASVLKSWPANNPTNDTCLFVSPDQLVVDAQGVPVIGSNVAIDHGDTNYLDIALCGDTDCGGNPRRVNGARLDVGAYEADWKARYAADLGKARLVAVTAASNTVFESASQTVTLVDGAGVTLEMYNPLKRNAVQTIRVKVTGAGQLTMLSGGVERVFADEGGACEYTFHSTDPVKEFNFAFAGTGSAELLACSKEVGMSIIFR